MPERLPKVDAADHRNMRSIGDLTEEEIVSEAMLCFEEVLALRLYSGPMFMKYNTVLRDDPVDFLENFKGNRHTTTIHLILSAILKLSRVQPHPIGAASVQRSWREEAAQGDSGPKKERLVPKMGRGTKRERGRGKGVGEEGTMMLLSKMRLGGRGERGVEGDV